MKRREFIVGLAAAGLAMGSGCMRTPGFRQTENRVMVVGFDGLDPKLLATFMKQDEFPNLRKLIEINGLRTLKTSDPPQSPVAWSNFITGSNPGGHAIFDFIHRKPDSYLPYLSTSESSDGSRNIKLGKWKIPLESGKTELLRKGKAFWELLEEDGVPSTIFRIPANFPPVESGNSMSGMGTPDLLGGYGSFTFFSETPVEESESGITGGEVKTISGEDGKFVCELEGPPNTFNVESPVTKTEFTVWADPKNNSAKFAVGSETFALDKGQWSNWQRLEFEMVPLVVNVSGIVVMYLKSVDPLQIYVSPINIDPENPVMPISHPPEYVKDLVKQVGLFYTQGMPEDTKALDHGILTDDEYLAQNKILNRSIEKIFRLELDRFKNGFLFYYFSATDLGSHMLWSAMDKTHPGYQDRSESVRGALKDIYKDMDEMLGLALESLDEGDTIIVMSDHGFAPFRRAFHLNSWLKDNGYLALLDDFSQGEHEFFMNVDWTRTKAYGLGFNGLYINEAGREGDGIVLPGPSKKKLMLELREKLEAVVDPETGEPPITNLYFADEIYSGKYVGEAPDMIVGYNSGYRGSWETAIGKMPRKLFDINDQKWTGDHCMDAVHVPGVVMSNRKIAVENPALFDLPVTILSLFGLEKGNEMIGKNIFGD
ncbi:alkaline phosphatase family protein [bacterium]